MRIILARLRATPMSLFIVAGIAALSHALWGTPYWLGHIRENGGSAWFHAVALPDIVTAVILLLSIRASADSGTDLARRPGRFLLVLALGAMLAEAVMSLLYTLLEVMEFSVINRPADSYLIAWLNSVLFGALFGWLGILHLQRTEEQARFAAAMARRSLLARQVAQSRLIAARARIDPELVARILRDVHARYRIDADAASALLDQLISHLRLAMTRARDRLPSPASELALIRSYLALREAESGVRIALDADLAGPWPVRPDMTPVPLFPLVRRLCDEAVLACAAQPESRIGLRIESQPACILIEVVPAAPFTPAQLISLKTFLAELSPGHDDILQHFPEPGGNRYVVQIAIR